MLATLKIETKSKKKEKMSLKIYLFFLVFIALLSLTGWIWVVVSIDPEAAGLTGQIIFFVTLFFGLSALFVFLLTWLRNPSKAENQEVQLVQSFRQGVLLAVMVIVILVLQVSGFLIWWSALLTLAAILLTELYFLSKR